MRIVIAPDSFKGSLSADQVCAAIAAGLQRVWPDAVVDQVPMADGGEGTVDATVAATGGRHATVTARGPLGEPVEAPFGLYEDGRAAVLEMAAASGLPLVPPDQRNPLRTTTYGTGQLIAAALDAGARRLMVGIGGSATNDGGTGCAQALGVTFLNIQGEPITEPLTGADLSRIARIDASTIDPRIAEADIVVACDVDNPLCGPNGASAIYGPQKGATPEMVEQLDAGLDHLAELIRRDLGADVKQIPGAGAAGGLGAGLLAFCGAQIRPGIDIVIDQVNLAGRIAGCDLVITGEGRLDHQSVMGKTISGVGRVARQAGVPVVALVGSVGEGAEAALDVLDGYLSILDQPRTLADAMTNAAELLTETASNLARIWSVAK